MPRLDCRTIIPALAALAAVTLAGCGAQTVRPALPAGTVVQEAARWVPVHWNDLPGWLDDDLLRAWPALLRSCERPAGTWQNPCALARSAAPKSSTEVREWLVRYLRPYRVEAHDGSQGGLATGYYEPSLQARRQSDATWRFPLHAAPADLGTRKPYWTRQEIDTLPQARAALRGREIAWLSDPLDALVLHIQGSGRLQLTEPDGRVRTVRLAYSGNNGHGYQSVGRWLIDRGELPPGQASWPAIRDWARRNPARVDELLWANPRYIFFREEALPDPALGPRGAQGVPLTPGRSIAIDPRSIPYGTPVWLDTTEPRGTRPIRRLVLAQDTGSAIVGAVRADFFWGWEASAGEQAGRMKQPLRMWVLWPR